MQYTLSIRESVTSLRILCSHQYNKGDQQNGTPWQPIETGELYRGQRRCLFSGRQLLKHHPPPLPWNVNEEEGMLKRFGMVLAGLWDLFLLLELIITGGGSNPGYWWPVLFLLPWFSGAVVMLVWRFTVRGNLRRPYPVGRWR
jgi:hypothetical protein